MPSAAFHRPGQSNNKSARFCSETVLPKHLRRFTEFKFALRIVTLDNASCNKGDIIMKALALLTAAAVTLFSVAASAQTYGVPYGKGKAPPPPPVVTKG